MPRVTRFVQTLNKDQQHALKRVYDRCPLYPKPDGMPTSINPEGFGLGGYVRIKPLTYREFRKSVQFSFDCAMVRWCGMWLGIEEDGYTHS